jgi:hypothetical protein
MIDTDKIFFSLDIDRIDPEMVHHGASRDQLDFVMRLAAEPSGTNTHQVFQQIPKHLRTPHTRLIPVGWGKVVSLAQFAHDDSTRTY